MNDKTLSKAFEIIREANDPIADFMGKYSDFLTETGERTVDYSGYSIPLDDYYYLFISFVDFSLNSFSVREYEEE